MKAHTTGGRLPSLVALSRADLDQLILAMETRAENNPDLPLLYDLLERLKIKRGRS